jgi:uncharacterized protein (DUF1015 family)
LNVADIAPLTPLRYDLAKLPQGLSSVVAPPYDVIDEAKRAVLVARHPNNIVNVDLPLGEGDQKYENGARILENWIETGVLVRDNEPAFYRYDQTFTPPGGGSARMRRGFLALVRAVPFSDRIVLPHERTLSGPKEDRLKLSRATHAALSPGFLLYRDPASTLDPALESGMLLAEFSTADGIHHALAKVTAKDAMRAIVERVAQSQLLIADGHHRYETAVRYAEEVSAAHPNASDRAEHRWYMAFLANGDDPNLVVFPTHRHVHSLPSFDFDGMLAAASATFDVRQLGKPNAEAIGKELATAGKSAPSFAAAAADGRVAMLSLKAGVDLAAHPTLGPRPAVLRRTDVALLHHGVLEHVLGITLEAQAAKTNIWYPQDSAGALASLQGGKGQVLFLMNATPVAQVREVAEAGEVMPQKSTFFHPKVLTGLAIHTLDPARTVSSWNSAEA